jgi:hypothetical protein
MRHGHPLRHMPQQFLERNYRGIVSLVFFF